MKLNSRLSVNSPKTQKDIGTSGKVSRTLLQIANADSKDIGQKLKDCIFSTFSSDSQNPMDNVAKELQGEISSMAKDAKDIGEDFAESVEIEFETSSQDLVEDTQSTLSKNERVGKTTEEQKEILRDEFLNKLIDYARDNGIILEKKDDGNVSMSIGKEKPGLTLTVPSDTKSMKSTFEQMKGLKRLIDKDRTTITKDGNNFNVECNGVSIPLETTGNFETNIDRISNLNDFFSEKTVSKYNEETKQLTFKAEFKSGANTTVKREIVIDFNPETNRADLETLYNQTVKREEAKVKLDGLMQSFDGCTIDPADCCNNSSFDGVVKLTYKGVEAEINLTLDKTFESLQPLKDSIVEHSGIDAAIIKMDRADNRWKTLDELKTEYGKAKKKNATFTIAGPQVDGVDPTNVELYLDQLKTKDPDENSEITTITITVGKEGEIETQKTIPLYLNLQDGDMFSNGMGFQIWNSHQQSLKEVVDKLNDLTGKVDVITKKGFDEAPELIQADFEGLGPSIDQLTTDMIYSLSTGSSQPTDLQTSAPPANEGLPPSQGTITPPLDEFDFDEVYSGTIESDSEVDIKLTENPMRNPSLNKELTPTQGPMAPPQTGNTQLQKNDLQMVSFGQNEASVDSTTELELSGLVDRVDGIDLEGNILNITNNEAVKNFLENYKELEPYLEQLNNIKEGETLKVLLDNDIESKDEPDAIEGGEFDLVSVGNENTNTLALSGDMTGLEMFGNDTGIVANFVQNYIEINGSDVEVSRLNLEDLNKLLEMLPETIKNELLKMDLSKPIKITGLPKGALDAIRDLLSLDSEIGTNTSFEAIEGNVLNSKPNPLSIEDRPPEPQQATVPSVPDSNPFIRPLQPQETTSVGDGLDIGKFEELKPMIVDLEESETIDVQQLDKILIDEFEQTTEAKATEIENPTVDSAGSDIFNRFVTEKNLDGLLEFLQNSISVNEPKFVGDEENETTLSTLGANINIDALNTLLGITEKDAKITEDSSFSEVISDLKKAIFANQFRKVSTELSDLSSLLTLLEEKNEEVSTDGNEILLDDYQSIGLEEEDLDLGTAGLKNDDIKTLSDIVGGNYDDKTSLSEVIDHLKTKLDQQEVKTKQAKVMEQLERKANQKEAINLMEGERQRRIDEQVKINYNNVIEESKASQTQSNIPEMVSPAPPKNPIESTTQQPESLQSVPSDMTTDMTTGTIGELIGGLPGIKRDGNSVTIPNNDTTINYLNAVKLATGITNEDIDSLLTALKENSNLENLTILLDPSGQDNAIEGGETSDTLALADETQIVPPEGGVSDLTQLNDLIKSAPSEFKSHIKLDGNRLIITKNEDVISFFKKTRR